MGPAFAGGRGHFFAATIVASKKFHDDNGVFFPKPNYCHRGISLAKYPRPPPHGGFFLTGMGPACAGGRGYFFAATVVASKKFRDDNGFFFPKPNYCHRGISLAKYPRPPPHGGFFCGNGSRVRGRSRTFFRRDYRRVKKSSAMTMVLFPDGNSPTQFPNPLVPPVPRRNARARTPKRQPEGACQLFATFRKKNNR